MGTPLYKTHTGLFSLTCNDPKCLTLTVFFSAVSLLVAPRCFCLHPCSYNSHSHQCYSSNECQPQKYFYFFCGCWRHHGSKHIVPQRQYVWNIVRCTVVFKSFFEASTFVSRLLVVTLFYYYSLLLISAIISLSYIYIYIYRYNIYIYIRLT